MVNIFKLGTIVIVSNRIKYWSNYSIRFEILNICTALQIIWACILTYLRKNKDWSFFSHKVLKLPLSVLLMASTWHNDTAQPVAVFPNLQFVSQHFIRMSMQTAGLPLFNVTVAATCEMINISPSSGVKDIALMRPYSCSSGVKTGTAGLTCTSPRNC